MKALPLSHQFSPSFALGQITIYYKLGGLELKTDQQPTILRLTSANFNTGILVDLLTSLDQLGFTFIEIEADPNTS